MQSCCRKTDYGFTLLEMMIVLIIGGVLTAIAIPAFSKWAPKYRVNGAARQVFSEMMAARAKAISESNNYVISFDTGNNSFTIHDDDNSDGAEDPGEATKTVNIPDAYPGIEYGSSSGDDVTFSGTPPSVTFKKSGLANKNGTVYLKPEGGTGLERRITVLLTGRVRLYK